MSKENALIKRLLLAATEAGARLFRNNTGTGWVGTAQQITNRPKVVTLNPGDVYIRNARPLHAGLVKGSSDLIGWKPVKVTEEMIGTTVAVFYAVEVKTGRQRATKEQAKFLQIVRNAGGEALVARKIEDVT